MQKWGDGPTVDAVLIEPGPVVPTGRHSQLLRATLLDISHLFSRHFLNQAGTFAIKA